MRKLIIIATLGLTLSTEQAFAGLTPEQMKNALQTYQMANMLNLTDSQFTIALSLAANYTSTTLFNEVQNGSFLKKLHERSAALEKPITPSPAVKETPTEPEPAPKPTTPPATPEAKKTTTPTPLPSPSAFPDTEGLRKLLEVSQKETEKALEKVKSLDTELKEAQEKAVNLEAELNKEKEVNSKVKISHDNKETFLQRAMEKVKTLDTQLKDTVKELEEAKRNSQILKRKLEYLQKPESKLLKEEKEREEQFRKLHSESTTTLKELTDELNAQYEDQLKTAMNTLKRTMGICDKSLELANEFLRAKNTKGKATAKQTRENCWRSLAKLSLDLYRDTSLEYATSKSSEDIKKELKSKFERIDPNQHGEWAGLFKETLQSFHEKLTKDEEEHRNIKAPFESLKTKATAFQDKWDTFLPPLQRLKLKI